MSRQVIIDDTDSKIQYYEGQGWFLDDTGSRDGIGSFGPTYLHTLHGISYNGSLSYAFEGTSVLVRGTVDLVGRQTASLDLAWECFVDRTSMSLANPVESPANNMNLCKTEDLNDGPHELLVEVSTSNQTFWVDYILYTPSPAFFPENAVVVVENNDPQITYSTDWQTLGDGNMTQTNGSIAKFSFTGTSLSWVGFVPVQLSHSASFATYSIDGSPSVSFQLNGLPPAANSTLFHQTFFTTPELQPGPHDLLVTHRGTTQQTPLTIDYLWVTINSTSGLSSTPGSTSQRARRNTPTAMIIGVIIGGVIVISLCFFFLRFYKKRHAKPHLNKNDRRLSCIVPAHPFILCYPASPSQTVHKYSPSGLEISAPLNNLTRIRHDTPPLPPVPVSSSHPSPTIPTGVTQPPIMNRQGPLTPNTTSNELSDQAEDPMTLALRSQNHQETDGGPFNLQRRIVHQDSGWRMSRENVISIEDVPPHYTAT